MTERLVSAILIPILTIAAAASGGVLAGRLVKYRHGFLTGILVCSPIILMFTVSGALLCGGWGEELMGTLWGVPLGLSLGAFSATFGASAITGGMGVLIARCVCLARRRPE